LFCGRSVKVLVVDRVEKPLDSSFNPAAVGMW